MPNFGTVTLKGHCNKLGTFYGRYYRHIPIPAGPTKLSSVLACLRLCRFFGRVSLKFTAFRTAFDFVLVCVYINKHYSLREPMIKIHTVLVNGLIATSHLEFSLGIQLNNINGSIFKIGM